MTLILDANNGKSYRSDPFKIQESLWHVSIFPNGGKQENVGSFLVLLFPTSMPAKWEEITIRYTIYCPQTNASYTQIRSSCKKQEVCGGWPSTTLLLTEIKSLNLEYLEIISNITILKITSNYHDKHPYILYQYPLYLKNHYHLEWQIDSTIYNQMKDAHPGKSFQSNIYDEMWVIKLYPNGYKSPHQPLYFLQLCALPSFVTKLAVQYTLSCTQTETTSTSTIHFSYDSPEWSWTQNDNFLSYEEFLNLNVSNLTFIVDINILNAVYQHGGSMDDYSINNYKWIISNPQIILNSTDQSCHWSNMFSTHNFDGWKIQLCPQVTSKENIDSFIVYVHLMSKPVEWEVVTARYTINIPQITIMSKYTNVHTFDGKMGWGWPPKSLLYENVKKLNLDFFEIIVNVTVLNIVSSQDTQKMLYQYPLIHHKNGHFEWLINSSMIKNMATAHNNKVFQSNIYDDMFLLNMYPNSGPLSGDGIVMLWLQICSMPPNVWKMTVKYTISWHSKFKITETNEFSYKSQDADLHKIMVTDDFRKLSEITFVVDIIIVGVVDTFYKNTNVNADVTEIDAMNEFNQQIDDATNEKINEWRNEISDVLKIYEESLSLVKEEISVIKTYLKQQSNSCRVTNNSENNVSLIFIIGAMVTIIVMFMTTKYIIYQQRVLDINHITNKNKDIIDKCAICMDNIRQYACIPCGHLCLCQNCKELINDKCPICHTKCKVIKIFKS